MKTHINFFRFLYPNFNNRLILFRKSILKLLNVLILLLIVSTNSWGQSEAGDKYYKVGYDFLKIGEYQKAIDNLSLSIKYYPRANEIYHYRGLAKAGLNNHVGAISDFTQAIKICSVIGEYYNSRAWSYCFTKEYTKAISDANIALSQNQFSYIYDTRGTAYGLLSMYSSALNDFNDAIKLESNPLYYYKRGLIKKVNNDVVGAVQDFDAAYKMDPTESYKKVADPLIKHFSSNSPSATTGKVSDTKVGTPPTLSPVIYRTTFGNWCIYFPGKPFEHTSSNSTMSTNYTAGYRSGEWLYMIHYIVIDYAYYKKYPLDDYLLDIRNLYAKSTNGTINSTTATSMLGFDKACYYKINTSGNYGFFTDGIVGNQLVRIGLFNSKRYPTNDEFLEFYKTFSKAYF